MSQSENLLPIEAYIKLMRASGSVLARVQKPLKPQGLTESQFAVLEALNHLGPLCQRDLAEKILRTSGNITMVVDNLQKRGLVVRQREQHDRRVVSVHLTDQGREIIAQVLPLMVTSITRQMSVLTREELATLATLCRKLGLAENDAADT